MEYNRKCQLLFWGDCNRFSIVGEAGYFPNKETFDKLDWKESEVLLSEFSITPKTNIVWISEQYKYVGIDTDEEIAYTQLEKAGFEGIELVWLQRNKDDVFEDTYGRFFADDDVVAVYRFKKFEQSDFFEFFLD